MSPKKLTNLTKSTHQKLYKVFHPSTPVKPLHYLEAESALGARLFGTIPTGVDRKFFHSTVKNVWIWHENNTTIRYEVRPHGVFKRIGSAPFEKLTGLELTNFRTATHHYLTTLRTELYKN